MMRSQRRTRLGRFLRNSDGGYAVQFALLTPLFVIAILGVVDVARLAWTISALEHASRQGARYAAVRGAGMPDEKTSTQIQDYTLAQYIGVDGPGVTASVTYNPAGDNSEGSLVTVTVSHDLSFFAAGLIGWEPVSFDRSSTLMVSGL